MADRHPVIEETAEAVYSCITDDVIRMRIEAREEYERRQRTLLLQLAEKDEKLAEMAEEIEELKRRLAEAEQ